MIPVGCTVFLNITLNTTRELYYEEQKTPWQIVVFSGCFPVVDNYAVVVGVCCQLL